MYTPSPDKISQVRDFVHDNDIQLEKCPQEFHIDAFVIQFGLFLQHVQHILKLLYTVLHPIIIDL